MLTDTKKIIGLDTETYLGKAILIATPDRYLLHPKTFEEIADWLGNGKYIAYNMNFDAQALLAYIPRIYLKVLARINTIQYGDYKIFYLPRKICRVEGLGRKFEIYDTAQHFHTSLNKAAKKYLGREKVDIKGIDISRMDLALKHHKELVIKYCQEDATLAQELWELLASGLLKVGLDIKNPISGASMTIKYFYGTEKPGAIRHKEYFKQSYFGGRNEVFRRGYIKGPIYNYDIHSAYPSTIKDLVDIRNCRCILHQKYIREAEYGTYLVQHNTSNHNFGVVPIRKGILYYPIGLHQTWVDKATLEVMRKYDVPHKVLKSYQYVIKNSVTNPLYRFSEMNEFYNLRGSNIAYKLAVKLCMNAVSGKFAQNNIGWEFVNDILKADLVEDDYYYIRKIAPGYYQNFAYAARITGECRAKLYEAMLLAEPNSLLLVATDGIYTTQKIQGLDEGSNMGQWGMDEYDKMIILGSGVYSLYKNNECVETKLRGFDISVDKSLRAKPQDDLYELIATSKNEYFIDVPIRVPMTLLWAMKKNVQINEIKLDKKKISLNMDSKRLWRNKITRRDIINKKYNISEPYLFDYRDNNK